MRDSLLGWFTGSKKVHDPKRGRIWLRYVALIGFCFTGTGTSGGIVSHEEVIQKTIKLKNLTVRADAEKIQGIRAGKRIWQHEPDISYVPKTIEVIGNFVTIQEITSGAYTTVYRTIIDTRNGKIVAQPQGNYLGSMAGKLVFSSMSPFESRMIDYDIRDFHINLIDKKTGKSEFRTFPVEMPRPFPAECSDEQSSLLSYNTLTTTSIKNGQFLLNAKGTICTFNFSLKLNPPSFKVTSYSKLR